jgi:type II secretory pathway pseudopilin PulG
MRSKNRYIGLTLVEQVVVLAGVVILAGISLPGIKAFFKTFESTDAAKTMISSALASARSIATKEQRYAGIRFQLSGYHGINDTAEDMQKLMEAGQYMVFIVHDPDKFPHGTELADGFRAVEGVEPIKLPDSIAVMDLKRRTNMNNSISDYTDINLETDIAQARVLRDTTSFSIIFSPAGKLVVHDVRIRNKEGKTESTQDQFQSYDNVFNTLSRVAGFSPYPVAGDFVQDDYAGLGLGQEPSRRSFIVYEKEKFRENYRQGTAFDYLQELQSSEEIYINPYTGTMLNSQ